MLSLSRRTFLAGGALALSALISGCSDNEREPTITSTGSAGEGSASVDAGSAPTDSADAGASGLSAGSALVAYFSATGNTAGVATELANHLGADVFEIQPAQPYTDADLNYNDSSSRTSVERAEDARPELAQVAPDGFDAYDTVFVGYPIWWGDAAWPVKTFVEGNDFTGKTVVPFCTSASSGIGGSGDELAALAGTGEWVAGERFSAGASADEVASWVDGLAL